MTAKISSTHQVAFALFVGDVIGPVEKDYNKENILKLAEDWKKNKLPNLDIKHAFACPKEDDEKLMPSPLGSCYRCYTESYLEKAKMVIAALNESKVTT
jgi:hypothetical protein